MKIGTMSILFREQPDTDAHIGYVEALERIAKAGFPAADLNLCQLCAHKTNLHLDGWEAQADLIAQTAARLNLALPQCHLPFKSKKVKWQTPEDLAYYNQMFYRAIDVAARIGFPWAVIHPERYPLHPDWDNARCFRETREEMAPFIEYALNKGLRLAYENMPGKPGQTHGAYCADANELAELIDSYGDERIGACWDTGHANLYYPLDQWDALHIVGKRLHCTHIHDNRNDSDLHLLPFSGTVKWPRVMAALRDIGYPGDLILEGGINYRSPAALKDENARHACAVMRCLEET